MATQDLCLKVGQKWRIRSGAIVTISYDRGELSDPPPFWRWALSNSHITNNRGGVHMKGDPHESDLIELIEDAP